MLVLYDLRMVSLTKKMIRGKPYYYARKCKRVDGKPKIVWQRYLGKPEDIVAAMTSRSAAGSAPEPKEAFVFEFGAVVALYDIAQRLRIVEFIDAHVAKAGSGPSVGTYMLVALINRCVAPRSKAGIAEWFQDTALARLVDIKPKQLTSQRYWDNMSRVSVEAIQAIERDLVTHAVQEFDLDVSKLFFDATNFFTYIDTFNERSTLAQRGKSKEGRSALRIVGLALLVTGDFHVPLLHRTYPGNRHDAPTFAALTADLEARYRQIVGGSEGITIVFDKGNNSRDNMDAVEASPYHFVGSLVPTQHTELLAIPLDEFHSLADEGYPKVKAYRTTKTVFGCKRTIVVTHNDNLFLAQSKTLLREIAKRHNKLRNEQERLQLRRGGTIRGGKPPTVASVRKKVQNWLKARHMKKLFAVDITEDESGQPELTYTFDKEAWEQLQNQLLGKTILFTDHGDDWSDGDIVAGYRGQHHVEDGFRTMKDTDHIALRPQHCWTDQKVEVHVFTCVLALMLCDLLRRELHRHGIQRSIPKMLTELGKIREVAVVYPPPEGKKNPVLKMTCSAMPPDRRALYDVLKLERYRSA